jgi:hypothetical protein
MSMCVRLQLTRYRSVPLDASHVRLIDLSQHIAHKSKAGLQLGDYRMVVDLDRAWDWLTEPEQSLRRRHEREQLLASRSGWLFVTPAGSQPQDLLA